MSKPEFISENDELDFSDNERNLSREILQISLDGNKTHKTRKLTDTILSELKSLFNQKSDRMGMFDIGCVFIEVEKDDGMSWAAQKVVHSLDKARPDLKSNKVCIADNSRNEIPYAFDLIKKKKAKNFFNRYLDGVNRKLSIPSAMLAVVFIILSQVIISLTSSNSEQESWLSRLNDPLFYVAITGAAVLYALSIGLRNYIQAGKLNVNYFEQRRASIIEIINKADEDKFEKMASNFSKLIVPHEFRIVVIDNYSGLDRFSKKVFENYFSNYSGKIASELWVIFDVRKSGLNLTNNALLSPASWFYQNRFKLFELQPINSSQKQFLAKKLKLDDHVVDYGLIKTICKGRISNQNWRIQYLYEYRLKYPYDPEIYGELELLYLISIISSPARMNFSEDYYIQIFSDKTKLRSRILEKILHNTKLNRIELKDRFKNFLKEENKLKEFIFKEKRNGKVRFSALPELKYTLINNRTSLKLPDDKLAHLFWCLYWGDKITQSDETSWVDKLCHHLKYQGNVSVLDHESSDKVFKRLFDIHLAAIDAVVKTALFDHLPWLINKTIEFSKEHSLKEKRAKTILYKIWQSFILTGDNSFLKSLSNALTITDHIITHEEEVSISYLRIIAPQIPSIKPIGIGNHDIQRHLTIKSLVINLYTKSISHSIDSMIENSSYDFKLINSSYDYEPIRQCIKEILRKWENEKVISLIDILNLSDGLWCFCMKIYNTYMPYNEFTRSKMAESQHKTEETKALWDSIETASGSLFEELIEASEKIVNLGKDENTNQIKKTLLADLYINLIMSLAVSYNSISHITSSRVSEHAGNINKTFKQINESFSFDIAPLNTISNLAQTELIEKVIHLMNLETINWRRLNLQALSNNVLYKKLFVQDAFNTSFKAGHVQQSLSVNLKENNLDGILSNLIVASLEKKSIQIKSHFVVKALLNAINTELSDDVQNELLTLIVFQFNHVGGDEVNNIIHLIEEFCKSDFIQSLLTSIPDEALLYYIIQYLNTVDSFCSLPTKKIAIEITEKRNQLCAVKEVSNSIMEIVDSKKFLNKFESIELSELDETLNQWPHNKLDRAYSTVLNSAIRHFGIHNGQLKSDSLEILTKNNQNFSWSGYLYLSEALALEHLEKPILSEQELQIVYDYLKEGMKTWTNQINATRNIDIYSVLNNLTPKDHLEYQDKMKEWLIEKMKVDNLRLMYFIEHRRSFDIFVTCYNLFKDFGLKTEISAHEYRKIISTPSREEIKNKVDLQANSNQRVPEPFFEIDNNLIKNSLQVNRGISAEFLIIGHFLFQTFLINESDYDHLRRDFNNTAQMHLTTLFRLIKKLDSIPEYFRAESYLELLEGSQFITPEDTEI